MSNLAQQVIDSIINECNDSKGTALKVGDRVAAYGDDFEADIKSIKKGDMLVLDRGQGETEEIKSSDVTKLDEDVRYAQDVTFQIGDPIEIEGKEGEVIDINDDDTLLVDLNAEADDGETYSYNVYPHDDSEHDCDVANLPEGYNSEEEFEEAMIKKVIGGKVVKFKKRTKKVRLSTKQKQAIKKRANKMRGKKVKASVLRKRAKSNKLRQTKRL